MTDHRPTMRLPTPPRRNRRRVAGAVLGVLCTVAVAACGSAGAANDVASLGDSSGTTPPTTAAAADPQDAMLQFTKCMRDHGIDMPDPKAASGSSASGSGGATGPLIMNSSGGGPQEKEKMDAANKDCKHFMDGVVQNAPKMDPEQEAKMKEDALAFSKCMRDNGVDMPDPQFSSDGGGMSVQLGSSDGSAPRIDPTSPAFQDAQKACESFMPSSGRGPSDGSGGGALTQIDPSTSGSK
jgi:hypothetical protein